MFILSQNRPTYSSEHNYIYSPTIDAFLLIGDFVLVKSHNRHTESGAAIGQIIDILPSNIVPQSETGSFDYTYWNGRLPNNYALCLVQVW